MAWATAGLPHYAYPLWIKGKETSEVVYGISSLPRSQASAAALLALSRDHWGVENQLHHTRDVTLGEDACRVRTANAPQALAAFRNTVLTCLRRLGLKPVEGLELFAENRAKAINLVLTGRTE